MTIDIAPLIDPAAAPAFGFAGLAAQMSWPLFRTRDSMLTIQLGALCSYATSYALMGQQTATAVCLTSAIQTTISLLAGDRPWLSRISYIFLPAVVAIGAVTWSGLPTVLAVAACCLSMIGRLQRDTVRMRGVQLTAFPFGAAHDVCVGAWPCLPGAIVSFVIAATALRAELRRRRETAQMP